MAGTGKFIVIEGIDGSGKSTQVDRLYHRLQKENPDVVSTFEPSDGVVGRLIRDMLNGSIAVDQRTLAALFAADRTDHLLAPGNGVKAMVDQGRVVLCDRYYFSSYAYHARYMDMDQVIQMNAHNAQILTPDLNIFIDVAPEVCLERIRSSRSSFDIYEKIEVLKAVRENYLLAFERLKDKEHIIVINGNDSLDAVERSIYQKVRGLLQG